MLLMLAYRNANLASRFTPLHPAVLRLIQRTVQVGHENGLEVSVCGEMASQPIMAFALIGLGVRQLFGQGGSGVGASEFGCRSPRAA